MKIENAELADLPSILELQKLCYLENAERYNDFTIPPLVQTIDELQDDYNKYLILKAEDNGKIIGSIRAHEKNDICYIQRVIVHPDYQNRGIGKKMMMEIEKRFPKSIKYELFTGYKDEKNIYFYSKLGYKIFKEETHSEKIKFVFFEKIREGEICQK